MCSKLHTAPQRGHLLVGHDDLWQQLTRALGQHLERVIVEIEALPGVVHYQDVHGDVVERNRPTGAAER